MNRTIGTESSIGLASEDVWGAVSGLIGRFGQAAEHAAERFDLGISRRAVRDRVDEILSDAGWIEHAGWSGLPGGRALQECLARLRELAPATYRKSVVRLTGVFVVHAYFRSRMTEDGLARSIVTGSFYEVMQDLLDDLLDGGGWTFPEALRLYDRCLRPITDQTVPRAGLEEDLADLMGPGQDGLERVLATATRELQRLVASSDARIRRLVAEGHEVLSRAQASTVYLRREALDIGAVAAIAANLPSPDPTLPWLDRLAIYASWPVNAALLDAGFTSSEVPQRELDAHSRAWLFFDEAISFLEHFAGTDADLREGVFNIACIHANLPAPILDENSFGGFTLRQRQSIFEKATECLVRAVCEGMAGGGPPDGYGLLAVMIPTIVFAMCKTPPDQAASFFAILAPALRATMETGHVRSEVAIPA